MERQKIHLTAAEIGCIWTNYMNDSMSKCILSYMLKHIQDEEIQPVIQLSLDISLKHLEYLLFLFNKEKYAVPNGFTEKDVFLDSPWLFTDNFCLTFVNQMARAGMLAYSGLVSMSIREDIRNYFSEALLQTNTLYNQSTQIALQKGLIARHPMMEIPKETDYIESNKYLSGLNPFTNKRPLNAIEISHLYMNSMTNSVGMKLSLAFAQTSPNKQVQEFMLRGAAISKKHMGIFAKALMDDYIETPHLPDLGISNSTARTFSDKLMMFLMSLLSASGIGNYATAAAASQRNDLVMNYERLSIEIAQFTKDGADLMIKHGWLEQPPGTKDKEKLATKKRG